GIQPIAAPRQASVIVEKPSICVPANMAAPPAAALRILGPVEVNRPVFAWRETSFAPPATGLLKLALLPVARGCERSLKTPAVSGACSAAAPLNTAYLDLVKASAVFEPSD